MHTLMRADAPARPSRAEGRLPRVRPTKRHYGPHHWPALCTACTSSPSFTGVTDRWGPPVSFTPNLSTTPPLSHQHDPARVTRASRRSLTPRLPRPQCPPQLTLLPQTREHPDLESEKPWMAATSPRAAAIPSTLSLVSVPQSSPGRCL